MNRNEIPVVERLRSELVGAVARRSEAAGGTRAPLRRWAAVAAAAAVVAVAAVAVLSLSRDRAPEAPPARALGAPESPIGSGVGSCVEPFSVENLREREFAFDGVIRSISVPEGEPDRPTTVTFEVTRWYKGGSGDAVELETYERPGGDSSVSLGGEDTVSLAEGQRVLGSGEDDFLWSCGFSMLYTPGNEALFEAAFNE